MSRFSTAFNVNVIYPSTVWTTSCVLAQSWFWTFFFSLSLFLSSRAIKTNQDLLSETPWTNIFYDDFWGTLLTHSGSHKSYRPLCTLSFRLNHAAGGMDPWGYHLVNVALHGAVTGLFTRLAHLLLGGGLWSLVAGLLFASHPIHTEAVAGVVGRADEGAALFFLLSLLCYIRYGKLQGKAGPLRLVAWFLGSLGCAACSMLWKELGVTVLALSALYDVCVLHRLKLRQIVILLYKVNVFSLVQRFTRNVWFHVHVVQTNYICIGMKQNWGEKKFLRFIILFSLKLQNNRQILLFIILCPSTSYDNMTIGTFCFTQSSFLAEFQRKSNLWQQTGQLRIWLQCV